MRHSVKKTIEQDEGSLLLSTFHLLFFISFLIISLTSIINNQLMQLQLVSRAYEAKAMIEVSQTLLRGKNEWENVETGTIYFSQGEVTIEKKTAGEYELEAKLNNNYTSSQTIFIDKTISKEERKKKRDNTTTSKTPVKDTSSEEKQGEGSIVTN
ncbi:hypothetical protein [Alkalibacterium kapii]|uniref:Competence protein ComGF n=1 Tax=Alkalibacterium kapii TaxID=426704 RepID=A0A511AT27_9LACT|nr:hypothetical protein [Alkalibacterium kapii]GEK91354.1 hypothetical protein AKA01nite_09760 [Alkalibacterium kapii]